MTRIPCGCGNIGCTYCNPCPANLQKGFYQFMSNNDKGWECPKCGSIYAPFTPECFKCNHPTITKE